MKKSIAIILSIFISTFIGCKSKPNISPKDYTNQYLEEIKTNTNNEIKEVIDNKIRILRKDKYKNTKLYDYIIYDISLVLSKMDFEVIDETINGNKAKVTVKIKGLDFSEIIPDLLNNQELTTIAKNIYFERNIDSNEVDKLNNILLNELGKYNLKERTGELNLSLKDNKWKMQLNDNFYKLLIGTNAYL